MLTHEIGHAVADSNPAAYEAFKTAAGYKEYERADLAADGLDDAQIGFIEDARERNQHESNPRNERRYSPELGTRGTYLGVDHTGLPYSGKIDRDDAQDNAEAWRYAHKSPDEHFAEVYAMAAHVPLQLYGDLVNRPAAKAEAARERVSAQVEAMSQIPDTAANAERRAAVQQQLDQDRADLELAERAAAQRKGQFDVMRNDVLHTDKAAREARARLGLSLDDARLAEFDQEAAELSTPEQIAMLEEKYRR